MTATTDPRSAGDERTLFGHPLGLYVLFFTEMWERFSFYGMKALLILYMVNHFVWSQEDASFILGMYAFSAYALPVLGGLAADKWLGAKWAVIVGGVLLSTGHFLMAFEPLSFFYSGLALIAVGVGFLKPNISTQVGSLYRPEDPRRDSAFTLFYMGINVGGLLGPLVCGWLRIHYGFHYGFAAAGVGMVLGLIVYLAGHRRLIEFSQHTNQTGPEKPLRTEHPPHVVRDRVIVLLIVFTFVILFWMAFEQSANVLIVWADKHTNLRPFNTEPPPVDLEGAGDPDATGGLSGWAIGADQTQSFNSFFIIAVAPLFAILWTWLDRRKRQPSTPTKMVLGIGLVAVAFAVLLPAAMRENKATTVALAELPEGVDLSQYGATRLHFNARAGQLHMQGVLPDIDRLRMLAEASPPEFVGRVGEVAKRSQSEPKPFSVVLDIAPPGVAVIGAEAAKAFEWDAPTKTLTVKDKVGERARLELLATAADPAFKAALDQLYVDASRNRVSLWWLIGHFLILTLGELCLSPVGLSLVTKIAPARHAGLFMGGWFLSSAVAEYLAHGFFGGQWGSMPPWNYFLMFVVICSIGAGMMALLVPAMKRMMHGVK